MNWPLCALIFLLSSAASADSVFVSKAYTPETVYDEVNDGAKGAVQLLWQKNPESTQYEIEIANGQSVYREKIDHHTKHIMIYFNKSYRWRVRSLDTEGRGKFSRWHPLKVVNELDHQEPSLVTSTVKPSVITYRSPSGAVEEITIDEGE